MIRSRRSLSLAERCAMERRPSGSLHGTSATSYWTQSLLALAASQLFTRAPKLVSKPPLLRSYGFATQYHPDHTDAGSSCRMEDGPEGGVMVMNRILCGSYSN